MKKLLVVCGATATGKTGLAAKCAKLLGSAVISADSQLVYRGLDIGTAKPRETCRSMPLAGFVKPINQRIP